ncbi:NAD(P)/FAD-dependent oxidoreductase [Pikeienuella piscinae]|uniref:NAD(P)/FAD-dependent oxidoreductase n=1 Tax=Pikeienuella piscinae TaxID=2748098 RepID=A0A7L5BUP7_9RHOB|nr:NAD(P)/FAD-dependent oxidoreductase [Pikeienuella piscinae]QIE55382.1 NAD(P)/FAD-dependent oxidoreductase [Pikeienuella piscinae]
MDAHSPTGKITAWLAQLDAALTAGDGAAAAKLFAPTSFWRDFVSFTWNLKTMEGPEEIEAMLKATLPAVKPRNWRLEGDATEADGVTEGWIAFETEAGRGEGHLRINADGGFTLLTTLRELKGFEEKKGASREKGVLHGADPNRRTWKERREDEAATLGYTEQPYVVIVGGGQGGIGLGARLRRLGVPTIIVEKNPRPGDSWRNRYKSLCLHDPVWYDHMPYLPYPEHWPVFAPKDKIGDWLESYTKIMELNYWGATTCESASYDAAKGEWTVKVVREGKPVTLRPKQLILATGMSSVPNIPDIPGAQDFKGTLHHSSKHKGGDGWEGKRCVVIGSNNSAHDICADLWEHGADVTMVQRSSTHIARSDSLMDLALGALYSEEALANGITTHKADMIFASLPYRILPGTQIPVYAEMKERDKDLYERLEERGFLLDFGEDGSGLFCKYLRRGSGYYIDVGASELVADGKIKLKVGATERITPNGVVVAGEEIPADLIVLATGYASMNGWAAQLISQEVADKVGKCWGMGSGTTKDPGPWEGELRNMWKPTQQEGLWFHGGNLHQSRHYSIYLSLQIKARMEGLATPVYALQETHHKS